MTYGSFMQCFRSGFSILAQYPTYPDSEPDPDPDPDPDPGFR
jgi:hypothetical protein